MGKQALRPARADGDVSSHCCGQCGKIFKSRKALYGHMRCHPARRSFRNLVGVSVGPPSTTIGPPFGNAVGFSSHELQIAAVLLMLAVGPCSIEVHGAASVSLERGFELKDKLFPLPEADSGGFQSRRASVNCEDSLGANECSAQATESGVEKLMGTVDEEEEENFEVPLSEKRCHVGLVVGSWEKCCKV